MRAYAILSNVPDIVFFTADEEYRAQLRAKTRRDGRTDDPNAMSGDINMDTLQMQFLPIFASAEMMKLVESPIKSITTSDGFTCVIRTFDDYVYIGMGDEDSETFIEGQLILLRDLISMLHGPVIANLKPSVPKLREARWKSTASILATMEEQRKSDQCYLVQALEIIRVNGFVRRIFADELEQALQKAAKQTGQGSWGSHAFLLVGTKLLAIYSQPQAPDLNPSDLFLLGLYVQDVFKRPLARLSEEMDAQTPARAGGLRPAASASASATDLSDMDMTTDLSVSMQSSIPDHPDLPDLPGLTENVVLPDARPDHTDAETAEFESPSATPQSSRSGTPQQQQADDAAAPAAAATTAPIPILPEIVPAAPAAAPAPAPAAAAAASPSMSPTFDDEMPDLPDLDGFGASNIEDQSDRRSSTSFHDAKSHMSTMDFDSIRAQPAIQEESRLGELRREAVFLHMPNNNFAPYIMHCVEVEKHVKLVVLSEGRETPTSQLMHQALHSLNRILELGYDFQWRQKVRTMAEEIPKRVHMAVRGAMGQQSSHAQIDGNYFPMPGVSTTDGRGAYEKTTKDLFLFYNDVIKAWCISSEMQDGLSQDVRGMVQVAPDVSQMLAVVQDAAQSPDAIINTWEVYDPDMNEFNPNSGLQIRCVRGDGAVRNRDGLWAKKSKNGKFYCEGPAPCLCGGCNGKCGPLDGCNCASCRLLDGDDRYGSSELQIMVQQERDLLRTTALENEKTLKKETENAMVILRKLVQQGSRILSTTTKTQLVKRVQKLFDLVNKKDMPAQQRWPLVIETTEGLSKAIRVKVGENIAQSNQNGDTLEVARMAVIEERVKAVLKDYYDFLHVKIHRNVTMTAYLDMFQGLVHFIYVDRTMNTMIAPCLTSTSGIHGRLAPGSLKQKVWDMHAHAMEFLKQGYSTMSLKAGDFRYTYFLWFEDAEKNRVEPREEIGRATAAWSTSFYHDLVARLFPPTQPIKCYELYLVHLGLVPFELVVRMGKKLVDELRDGTN